MGVFGLFDEIRKDIISVFVDLDVIGKVLFDVAYKKNDKYIRLAAIQAN